MFFAFAIAIKTYLQKIGDPADMASTASVAFTINHIAAVFVPVLFGGLWLISPSAVFFAGAAMACISLILVVAFGLLANFMMVQLSDYFSFIFDQVAQSA